MGHGLDDVVQWFMFPVGDPGTGGIQSHVNGVVPSTRAISASAGRPSAIGTLLWRASDATGRSSEGSRKIGLLMSFARIGEVMRSLRTDLPVG